MKTEIVKMPNDELKAMEVGALSLIEEVTHIQIVDTSGAKDAAHTLKGIKVHLKSTEDLRKTFTQPINQSLKAINAKFKEATKPLKEAETIIKSKILEWTKKENIRIAKEEQKRQKLQEAHYKKGHNVNPLIQLERVEKVGAAHTRTVKKWRLVSFEKLSDEYKIANEVLINKLVRGGKKDISGIEIYDEDVLAVR